LSFLDPTELKQARVLPLLKKPTLDPDEACSYRPIFNLPYLSKLTERVVVSCFAEHSSTYNLLPVQQPAYRPFHSTEAALVGSRSNLAKIANSDRSVQVDSSKIQPSAVVRDLGLHLDSELSMKHHVAKVAAICHYHLRPCASARFDDVSARRSRLGWCSQW